MSKTFKKAIELYTGRKIEIKEDGIYHQGIKKERLIAMISLSF
jgi:arsenate reductase-like glutaredoxin family protein